MLCPVSLASLLEEQKNTLLEKTMDKSSLRQLLLTARRAIPSSARQQASKHILHKVITHPQWLIAKHIGCYVSLNDEVFTHELFAYALATGKQIAAPVIHPVEHKLYFCPIHDFSILKPGLLGILEPELENPVAPETLNLLIVPGVGFDLQRNRLGFGKGFYDRFLATTPAFRLALAFDAQIIPELPTFSQDIPMHAVLTEKRILQET
jgi:5-formyltetrahydrofolate cyclo-ligase